MDQRSRHQWRPAIRVKLPRLHVVTNDEVVGRDLWLETASGVLEAGGPDVALHVRVPRSSGRRLFRLCSVLAPVARRSGALLLVNDRVDIALTLRLGAHLGQRSLDVRSARTVLGSGSRIGVSCHGQEEVVEAVDAGADYVFLGSIFESRTHPGVQAQGLESLRLIVDAAGGVPVIAIGGIGLESAPAVVAAGAHGAAVIRGVWDASDSRAATVRYISALANAKEVG